MAETSLEMAERQLRESEDRVSEQRAIVTALEKDGNPTALDEARRLLLLLEASRDVHKTLLARERVSRR